jgi:glycerol-3-phosphate dehydrogenase
LWRIHFTGPSGDQSVLARALVNAAGPWVNQIINQVVGGNSQRNVRLVKGSHIITPKFWDGDHAYLVQNTDKRVIFINPYEGDKALIGTTDIAFNGRPEDVAADEEEIRYLLNAVNRYFKHNLRREDVLQSFSGVRPLFDDGAGNPSAVTRDYVFDLNNAGAPLLNVFGGKITTFRKLSEHGVQLLQKTFPDMGPDWTVRGHLPGGDISNADFSMFIERLQLDYPWLPNQLVKHYARLYGTRARNLIGEANTLDGLGRHFGGALYEAEAQYLFRSEWARTPEDILMRRTKHILHLSSAEQAEFTNWFASLT